MFNHVMVGSNDIERAKIFYDALFTTIGGTPAQIDQQGRLRYVHKDGLFMVTKPLNGASATCANGGTIGFSLDSSEQVDAWHKAGCLNGGRSVEQDPGPRTATVGQLYLAYLRDPDQNKLCGVHRSLE